MEGWGEAAPNRFYGENIDTATRALNDLKPIVEACDPFLLESLRIEYIEQPVRADDLDGLKFVHERSPLPIIADESCVVSADIPAVVGRVSGINIKLSKCGGLREALRMIATARSHGLKVMAGCMIETSLGITAAAHFAPLLDYADFDGAALLSDDPFSGATIA